MISPKLLSAVFFGLFLIGAFGLFGRYVGPPIMWLLGYKMLPTPTPKGYTWVARFYCLCLLAAMPAAYYTHLSDKIHTSAASPTIFPVWIVVLMLELGRLRTNMTKR